MSTSMRIVTPRSDLSQKTDFDGLAAVRPAVMQPDTSVFEAAKCLGGNF